MLNEEERKRFVHLQQRELDGTLDDSNRAELDSLVEIVTTNERAYLPPATERIRAERDQIQAQNEALKPVLRRQSRLARRLEHVIALSKQERAAIQAELAHALKLTGAEQARR